MGVTGPPPAIVFPFISQIEVWPLMFCSRMSEPPAPVPMACQLVPGLATGPPPIKLFPFISQTDTCAGIFVLKQDVGKTVLVEITASDCLPGRPGIGS